MTAATIIVHDPVDTLGHPGVRTVGTQTARWEPDGRLTTLNVSYYLMPDGTIRKGWVGGDLVGSVPAVDEAARRRACEHQISVFRALDFTGPDDPDNFVDHV